MKNQYDGILNLHKLAWRIEDSGIQKTNTQTPMPDCNPPKDPYGRGEHRQKMDEARSMRTTQLTLGFLVAMTSFALGYFAGAIVNSL